VEPAEAVHAENLWLVEEQYMHFFGAHDVEGGGRFVQPLSARLEVLELRNGFLGEVARLEVGKLE
jgi:hypothetical protein